MEGAKVWLDKSIDIEDALVVCCFPSVGMVSSVVAHFLIDHLNLEFVGGVAHPKPVSYTHLTLPTTPYV